MRPGGPRDEQNEDELAGTLRSVAVARLLAAPLLIVLGLLQPASQAVPIAIVSAVAAVHLSVTTRLMLRGDPRRVPVFAVRFGDLLLLAAAVPFTGPDQPTFALVALLAVFLSPSLLSAAQSLALYVLFVVFVGGTLLAEGMEGAGHPRPTTTVVLATVLMALLSQTGGTIERRRLRRLQALAAERRQLLTDASELAERQRRTASQGLHDGVLQTLLAAGQDLDELQRRDADDAELQHARELVRSSVEALRDSVTEVHPGALSGSAFPAALGALVKVHRTRDGATIEADIDPAATGPYDDELYVVAREMLANVLARPRDTVIHVRAWTEEDHAMVEIWRDGSEARPGPAEGDSAIATVGIAWSAERLRRVGGGIRLDLSATRPGRARAWAPLGAAPDRG